MLGVATDITDRKRAEEIIRSSLNEKETLLKEIHHRIKNNLQIVYALLSLQAKNIKPENAQRALADSQSRVKSIALVHEKLYKSDDLRNIDFADYLMTLALSLSRTYDLENRGIALKIEAEPIPLDVDTALPCSLVVNELVTNALKHAFPPGRGGEVRVTLRVSHNKIHLVVSDNGVGFAPEVDFEQSESLGLQLVRSLAGQLNAQLKVEKEAGTRIELVFPKTGKAEPLEYSI